MATQGPELVDELEDEIRAYVMGDMGGRRRAPAESQPLAEVLIAWANWQARQIEQRPRAVHRSPNLIASPKAIEHRAELDDLIRQIVQGDDLTPLLSRGAQDIGRRDRMGADWGIQHLHFRPEGGSDIVFGVFRPDDAYLVGIYPHNSFSVREAVEIIVRTWPEANIFRKLEGLEGVGSEPTDAGRAALREVGVSTSILEIDGVVYAAEAIGQTAAGGSILATIRVNRTMHVLRDLRENLDERLDHYRDHAQRETGSRPASDWEATVRDGSFGLVSDRIFVPLGDL